MMKAVMKAVIGIALAVLPGMAAAQGADVTGTVLAVWGDPPDDRLPPVLRFILHADSGAEYELQFSDELLALHGGVTGLNRRRVTVRGELRTDALLNRLRVSLLRADDFAPRLVADELIGDAQLDPALVASTGASLSRPFVTILCRFADSAGEPPRPPAHFEQLMGNTWPGADHYWREVTEGRIDLQGSVVVGWYTLPGTRAEYVPASGNANLTKLANDCTAAADPFVYFPSFFGVNMQFDQRLDCCSWGGSRVLSYDGVTKVYGTTWMADWAMNALGTWIHEIGHSFGLPHSGGPYGRTYDSRWDVMSASSWFRPPGSPFTLGTHTNGYHKNLLGLIPQTRRVVATDSLTRVWLERSAQPRQNGNAQLIQIPLLPGSQLHYTVEARKPTGYDAPLAAEAVVIHSVVPGRGEPSQVVDADGNGDPNDGGSMWGPNRVFRDVAHGISVSVDSVTDGAFLVTVRRNGIAVHQVTPGSRSRTVDGGTAVHDSAGIAGPALPWQATTRSQRLRISTPSGTGPATLRWHVETAGLSPGLYVDTIRVFSPGSVWPALVIDSLHVAPAQGAAVHITADRLSRGDSVLVQRSGMVDSMRVQFHGPGASGAAWTATRTRASTLFWRNSTPQSVLTGTGNATIHWYHWPGGLPPGVYVDTLRISVAGAEPLLVIDTMRVLQPPTVTITRFGPGRTIVAQGSGNIADSVHVQLGGDWDAAGGWTVSNLGAARFLRPQAGMNAGSGPLRFQRMPLGRDPGTYVDTLRITPTMVGVAGAVLLVDTLVVAAAPLTLDLNWKSRHAVAWFGATATADSVLVMMEGPNATSAEWRATGSQERITIGSRNAFTAVGLGNGTEWLRWHRNVTGRPPGIYVDTITVRLVDGSQTVQLVDTLRILQVTAAASPTTRLAVALEGSSVLADSTRVELSGGDDTPFAWEATARAPWLRVQTTHGTGSATVRWTRETAGLPVGIHVDTITVRVPLAPASAGIVDTLRIIEPIAVTTDTLRVGAVAFVYRDTLRSTGGDGHYSWTVEGGSIPSGIDVLASGVIQGTPTAIGQYEFTVRATSLGFSGSRTVRLRVLAARVVITNPVLRDATMGAPYADTLRATGGDGALQWSLIDGALPAGLALNPATGAITGIPEAAGAFNVTVRALAGTVDTTGVRTLQVGKPVLADNAVVEHLLGGAQLPPDHARFLDLLGNRNGRVDAGDVRAWLQDLGRVALPGTSLHAIVELPPDPPDETERLP
jgi:M6 family metalloprotease-like protein